MNDERRHTQDEILGKIQAICEFNSAQLDEIKEMFEGYVTKEEFGPVKLISYGTVTMILVGFWGYVIKMALR